MPPFTGIPHDVLGTLAQLELSSAHWRILAVVWNETLGHQEKRGGWKKGDKWTSEITRPISISDLVKSTHLSERSVKRAMNDLVAWHILLRPKTVGRGNIALVTPNGNISTWNIGPVNSDSGDTISQGKGDADDTINPPLNSDSGDTISQGKGDKVGTEIVTTLSVKGDDADTILVPGSDSTRILQESSQESSTEERGETAAATAAIFQFIADNFPPDTLTGFTASQVNDFIGEYGSENVMFALREACTNNHRNMGYARGILKRLAKEHGVPGEERAGPYRGPVRMPPPGQTPHLIIGPQNSQ